MSVLGLEIPAGPLPRPPESARAAMLREMREGIAAPGGVWVLSGPSGVRLGEAHFRWLHEATAGNPRHLQKIVDFLRGTEVLVPSAGGWRRGPGRPLAVLRFQALQQSGARRD